MKKRGILYIILALSAGLCLTLYLLLGFYYTDSFSYGTWINEVYCTGKTPAQANEELKNHSFYNGMVVTGMDGEDFFVDSGAIDYSVDYLEELTQMLDRQNPIAWGLNMFKSKDREIIGNPTFDEEKLKALLSTWGIFDVQDKDIYELKKDDEGYYLVENEIKSANFDKYFENIKAGLYNRQYALDLSTDEELYDIATASEEDEKLYDLYQKIEKVQNLKASIKIGEAEISAKPSSVSEWMVTIDELTKAQNEELSDENPGGGMFLAGDKVIEFPDKYKIEENFVTDEAGNILLSCSKIYDFLENSLSYVDTNKCIDRFQKDGKGLIYVSGNKNGKLYDIAKEYTSFVEAVTGTGPEQTEVTFPGKSFVIDGTELGKEYILVDMGNQHLRYYKNGKVKIEYDIVTGNTGLGRGTPVGLFHIYNKRYHTILRGVDYASYVNYWLGVNKGIGIHDATWRKDFGGEIYKHSGSHGCINSPLELMEKLYETVEVGVPVLLYY
ncbi:L,D-transpeptidase [Butyrivibrio sp. XPD2002]|uniref:L,D-transpeptidase n=1 Tax=Butyrivibrio sp. XPD2002 TaxID=1280665 RepID=UPI0009DC1587|nr:L,D-transpeptidase [Butyrivibrio sp. XPD2002]